MQNNFFFLYTCQVSQKCFFGRILYVWKVYNEVIYVKEDSRIKHSENYRPLYFSVIDLKMFEAIVPQMFNNFSAGLWKRNPPFS